jgi:serine protease inhibitor ecotin
VNDCRIGGEIGEQLLAGWWFQTFFFHGIILPIDSCFSRWLKHVKTTKQIANFSPLSVFMALELSVMF